MLNEFKFGLETEYILKNVLTNEILWFEKTNFKEIYNLLENISLEEIPSLDGLDAEPAHKKILPFVVEGYHIKDQENHFNAIDMHPKGVEIRSPVCQSIDQCLDIQKELFERLKNSLKNKMWSTCILSHHPWATEYYGPQANRPKHFWEWAKKAMTTYGPDINISCNDEINDRLFNNKQDFEELLNYYAPALVAFSSLSPFFNGQLLKNENGQNIRSVRTLRRSDVAPMIEWHENENNRIEFKFFDMPLSWEECKIYFIFCLILITSHELKGRATSEEKLSLLKNEATLGLTSLIIQDRLSEIINAGKKILPQLGFENGALDLVEKRLKIGKTPADYVIEHFLQNDNLSDIISLLSHHYDTEQEWIDIIYGQLK